MKKYKCKDGTFRYTLPKCSICSKRSNTTDKETAQIAWRIGWICRKCTEGLPNLNTTTEASTIIGEDNKSIWEKIRSWFK